MSEKLCALRKIGGGMSKKVLWTNPSPTSTFNNQNITLSDDVNNYDYIELESRQSTSNDTRYHVLMAVSDWSSDYSFGLCNKISGTYYVRRFVKVSDTSGNFDSNASIWGTITQNSNNIPLYVYGVKV